MSINRNQLVGIVVLLTLLFIALIWPVFVKADSSNLAPNPSFEKTPYTDYETHGNGKFSHASVAHTGSHSIKIVRSSGDLTDNYGRWVSKIHKIELPANSNKVTFHLWLKGTGLVTHDVQIGFNFWDEDLKYISSAFKHVTPGTAWKKQTISSTAIPENAHYIRLEIRLKGDGTLWADDVSLTTESGSSSGGGGEDPPADPTPPPDSGTGTYYVATNGSNSNIGTISNPFKTIQHAVNLAQPGDTIVVRGGVYVEEVNITTSGTASHPITIANYAGETPILDGNYTLPPVPKAGWAKCGDDGVCFHYDALLNIKANYITVTGLEIRESLGRGIRVSSSSFRPKHVNILNNTVHDIRGGAIVLYHTDHVLVEGNEVYHAGNFAPYDRPMTELGWPGAIYGNNANHVTYRKNIVHENWTEGIMPSSQHGSSDIVVEDNVLWDNRALQIYVHRIEDAVIEGNIAYCTGNAKFNRGGNYPPGIPLANELQFDGGTVTKNVDIINNLVVGCKTGIEIWNAAPDYLLKNILIAHNTVINPRSKVADKDGIGLNLLSNNNSNVDIYNNVIQVSGGNRLEYVWGGGTDLHFSHNLWSSNPSDKASSTHDVVGDAKLVNASVAIVADKLSANDYKLTAVSPANAVGKNIDINQDFWDKSRGATPDLGFHER